jgi:hypothetical protein
LEQLLCSTVVPTATVGSEGSTDFVDLVRPDRNEQLESGSMHAEGYKLMIIVKE